MRFCLVIGLAIGAFAAADAPQSSSAKKDDALQGAWKLVSGEADGKALSETQLTGGKLEIKDARYNVVLPGVGTITGTQKLGATKEFKTIDITDETGAHKGKTCRGIYELKGDEFRVLFAAPGADRPTKFKTEPDSGQWMHLWKRVKE
jgi:uncharacterized protein (TIGR03067 family)